MTKKPRIIIHKQIKKSEATYAADVGKNLCNSTIEGIADARWKEVMCKACLNKKASLEKNK